MLPPSQGWACSSLASKQQCTCNCSSALSSDVNNWLRTIASVLASKLACDTMTSRGLSVDPDVALSTAISVGSAPTSPSCTLPCATPTITGNALLSRNVLDQIAFAPVAAAKVLASAKHCAAGSGTATHPAYIVAR